MELQLNNIIFSNEQIETIAYNCYNDIGTYILKNFTVYLDWFLNKISKKYIQELKDKYNYKICNYEERK